MKIPITPPGGAPYYPGPPINGIEMNPQWQGNGVIVDGALTGNGTPYVHMPHIHPAGYVPPPAYSPPPLPPTPEPHNDFSEYMWMENMEQFDETVMQQLEEEALMEQCIEAMLADEREAQNRAAISDQVIESTLNPLAAEFVPKFAIMSAPPPPEVEAVTQASTSDDVKALESAVAEISISNNNESSESADSTDGAKASHSGKGGDGKKSLKTENIVVVSAKDTVKTAREQKVEKKRESTKPDQKPNNKEVKKEENVKNQNSKPAGKPKPANHTKPTNQSSSVAEIVETKPVVKEEVCPIDLQGPPLPIPASLATATPTPVVEPEVKPAAPVVFNYAAAARANLPPKQPAVPVAASVPPKDTSRTAPPKTEAPISTKDATSESVGTKSGPPRQNRQGGGGAGAGQKVGHKPSSAGGGKKGKK